MSNEKASSSQVRAEYVENARRFFKNPKIRSTPLDEQKKFLLSKGVTEAEIESALESIPEKDLAANQEAIPIVYQTAPPVPPQNSIMSAAQNTMVIAGATYMVYKFVRSWLLPKFFDIADPAEEERRELHTRLNELQNSTKFVMDTVTTCSDTVSSQQEQLNRALTLISNSGKGGDLQRLQTDLAVIKSLLLRGSQFPSPTMNVAPDSLNTSRSTPKLNGQHNEIPAWQLSLNKESELLDSQTTSTQEGNSDEHLTSSSNNEEVFDDVSS